MTSLDMRSNSAVMKRAEQLKRWEESDTNQAPSVPRPEKGRKIKFSSGCVFLAACSSGDKDEVLSLLENGADINTANVDGLTALHQACIDDNLEMVEFLVEHGADINRQDNEGWTPLHATASCGFVSIARYLVEHGADVAAVNSDGDLAVDLAVDIQHMPMIEYMQKVVNEHNIDLQKARDAELDQMLKDAKQWLRSDASEADRIHPKTGATALHVAAAKGYTKVLSLLLAGRANVDKQDNDGWTPLHAAAHWGQKEAAEMLVNAMADMDLRNYSGLTCIDVADRKMVKYLEELRASNKRTKRRPSSQIRISDTIENHNASSKIIRVEVKPDQTKEQANDEKPKNITDSTAFKTQATTDAQAEEEAPWRRNSLARVRTQNDSPTKNQVPDKDVIKSNTNTETSDVILRRTQSFENDEKFYQKYNELRARIKANSCPILPATEISNSNNSNSNNNNNNNNNNINNNNNNNNNNNESNINRISSIAPPLSVALARLYLTTASASTISPAITTSATSITPITTNTTNITSTSTIPVQINTVQRSASLKDHRSMRKQLTSPPASPANVANVGSYTATSTTTNTTPTNTATASGTPIRRSFVPPVRDEESETQRKAHAKRVRETRRSTQGVTLDEIKSAEELVKKKNANMNSNNNSGNIVDPTKEISQTQENLTSIEQQADEYERPPPELSISSTSPVLTIYHDQEQNEDSPTETNDQNCDQEIEEITEKTLQIPLHSEEAEDNCLVNETDQTDQEKSAKEETKIIENIDERNKSTTEYTNRDESCNSSEEEKGNEDDEKEEIYVNFTLKRNDAALTISPAITVESVEKTITIKPESIESEENIYLENSVDEFQHISTEKPQNETSEISENNKNENINLNNSNETEKTDLIEKAIPTSNKIIHTQELDDNNANEFMISSVASTTSLIKRMRATASSLSSLIQPEVEPVESIKPSTLPIAPPPPPPPTTITTTSAAAATATATLTTTTTTTSPTLESPVRLRDKRSLFDLVEKRYNETHKQPFETNSNASRNSEGEANSCYTGNITVSSNDNKTTNQQSSSLPNSPMHSSRETSTAGGNNLNTSSYSGISASERRPSWRLKFSNDSKFKLEDVNTGATFPPNNSTIIPSAPAVIAAANQRRINSVGNAISSSNQSLNSIGRPVSAPVSSAILHSGSNASSVLSCGDNNASNEKSNDNCNNTGSIGSIVSRKYNVTTPAGVNVTSISTTSPMTASTNTTAKSNKEDNDNDKENDSRSALATQAVIQRRRKPKRRSTGVVHLDMDDLDPERQDSANDADEKESGSEQRASRSRGSSSTASSSNPSVALKNDTKSQNQTENGEPDYKALWQAARLENDQLKLELLKKDEQLVQTNAAMSRITNATTKNSLSELEKRERRAMERKLSELEEELKQLDFYKAENLRLKEENGALIRVISKLSK